MKGLSVLLTIVLLILANQLAVYLKRAGALPAENHYAQNAFDSDSATQTANGRLSLVTTFRE